MNKIRSQDMMQRAYLLVEPLKDSNVKSQYRSLALTFPSMILQSGLSQTTGFLLAKGKDKEEHLTLLAHLANLLNFSNGEQLHQHILQSHLTEYQLLTRKALDASTCLKRYTQALLESEKDKGKANE